MKKHTAVPSFFTTTIDLFFDLALLIMIAAFCVCFWIDLVDHHHATIDGSLAFLSSAVLRSRWRLGL
jgi:hypothetical protein